MTTEIALYRKYPKLRQIPRIELADFPTPVQKLEKLSTELGVCNLWIKRDDLCSKKYGGNKPRKYEFILADAQKKGKTLIVTIGGIGSNHTLANTIFGKDLGMDSEIYLFDQPLTTHVRHNLLCDFFHGAKMHYTGGYVSTFLKVAWKLLTDKRSFLVMPGASVPLGTIGYVNAGLELAEQIQAGNIPEPDHLFVAVGSTGTCAGLTLGLELAGLKTKVHGIGVSMKIVTSKSQVLKLAQNTLKLMRRYDSSLPTKIPGLKDRLSVTHEFFGGEYGRATHEGLEAIDLAKKDNITLDFTYTGKTFSAVIAYCREKKECACNETILYWNTLNSVDLTCQYNTVNYQSLPKEFWRFFDNSEPLDETPVFARKKQN